MEGIPKFEGEPKPIDDYLYKQRALREEGERLAAKRDEDETELREFKDKNGFASAPDLGKVFLDTKELAQNKSEIRSNIREKLQLPTIKDNQAEAASGIVSGGQERDPENEEEEEPQEE